MSTNLFRLDQHCQSSHMSTTRVPSYMPCRLLPDTTPCLVRVHIQDTQRQASQRRHHHQANIPLNHLGSVTQTTRSPAPFSPTRVLAIARYLRLPCSSNRPDPPPPPVTAEFGRAFTRTVSVTNDTSARMFRVFRTPPGSEASRPAHSETAEEIAEEHHVRGEGLRLAVGPRTFWALSRSVWLPSNRIQGRWGMRLNTQGFPLHKRYGRRQEVPERQHKAIFPSTTVFAVTEMVSG
jgi:hypothetical protein